MFSEAELKKVLQEVIKNVDKYNRWGFDTQDQKGKKEDLDEYIVKLEELSLKQWIKLEVHPHMSGKIYSIEVTPKGHIASKS